MEPHGQKSRAMDSGAGFGSSDNEQVGPWLQRTVKTSLHWCVYCHGGLQRGTAVTETAIEKLFVWGHEDTV